MDTRDVTEQICRAMQLKHQHVASCSCADSHTTQFYSNLFLLSAIANMLQIIIIIVIAIIING
jgi:hypothetical protein